MSPPLFYGFFLVFVSPYGSLWIYDGITWLPRRPSSPPVNLVSAVADAWQAIRRFVLNDLVTLVRERPVRTKCQNQNPKRLRCCSCNSTCRIFRNSSRIGMLYVAKAGDTLKKNTQTKNQRMKKKGVPIHRESLGLTFRGSAAGFQLSALSSFASIFILPVRPLPNHGFAVQMTSRFLIIDRQILERQRWQVPQTFCPFKRGGAVTFQHCGFGVVLKQQALGTHTKLARRSSVWSPQCHKGPE